MIKVVLFDFGGVLSETGRTGFMRQMFAQAYGMPSEAIDISAFHKAARRGQADEKRIFEELNRKYGKQVTQADFVSAVQAAYVPALPVLELAEQLRQHGLKTGILSNIFSMNAEELRRQGLYRDFDPVLLSYEAGSAKPDEAFYRLATERSGVRPEEILFIDDQEKCIVPAQKMGMHTILAQSSQQIVDDTRKLLHTVNGLEL